MSTAFTVCPNARGSQNVLCSGLGALKISVDAVTAFQSEPVGSVAIGRGSDIQLFVNRLTGIIRIPPYEFLTSPLPKGLRIEPAAPQWNGMITYRILGAPEAGQGGRYDLSLEWTDQLNSVKSPFRLEVLEGASITSPATFTFFEGIKPGGQVTTKGYPVNSVGMDCGPGKDCGDMTIRMDWASSRRIEGLALADRSGEGVPTGVGRFEGTIPAGSSGIYDAVLRAQNGRMAPPYEQRIRFIVRPTADLTGDGVVDCADLTAIKAAIGSIQPGPGLGFDLTGDILVDDKDLDAMVRAMPALCTCQI